MLRRTVSSRAFSSCAARLSNVGSMPIMLPEGVTVSISKKDIDPVTKLRMHLESQRKGKPPVHLTHQVDVTGPKGSVSLDIANFVTVKQDQNKLKVTIRDTDKKVQKSMWGTTRTLLSNGVNGVSEGHMAIIKFVGTGYRATLGTNAQTKRQELSLRVGYCVPIVIPVPQGLTVTVPVQHRVIVEGIDKQQVKQLAATIRKHRPPEPYKGKGIFVDGETIKLKARKIK